MPKISSLMFEQRHVFDSGTLYNNEHKDHVVRKAGETISDILIVFSFNTPQLQSMDYEITRAIETLGGQTDRVQHSLSVLKVDTIAYTHKVNNLKNALI